MVPSLYHRYSPYSSFGRSLRQPPLINCWLIAKLRKDYFGSERLMRAKRNTTYCRILRSIKTFRVGEITATNKAVLLAETVFGNARTSESWTALSNPAPAVGTHYTSRVAKLCLAGSVLLRRLTAVDNVKLHAHRDAVTAQWHYWRIAAGGDNEDKTRRR